MDGLEGPELKTDCGESIEEEFCCAPRLGLLPICVRSCSGGLMPEYMSTGMRRAWIDSSGWDS